MKLYGAALAAHNRKVGKKSNKKSKKSKGGSLEHHKAYSYKSKSGKMVHVAAHTEHK